MLRQQTEIVTDAEEPTRLPARGGSGGDTSRHGAERRRHGIQQRQREEYARALEEFAAGQRRSSRKKWSGAVLGEGWFHKE